MSKISKKRAPSTDTNNRAFEQVYKDLNELIDAVNQPANEMSSKTTGKEGDLRVVSAEDSHKLQIKTKNGWSFLVDNDGNEITTKLS
jgi:hypothetical protein